MDLGNAIGVFLRKIVTNLEIFAEPIIILLSADAMRGAVISYPSGNREFFRIITLHVIINIMIGLIDLIVLCNIILENIHFFLNETKISKVNITFLLTLLQ